MDASPGQIQLIAGLGNPGERYAITRHNAGFLVLDRLAAVEGAAFSLTKAWKAHVATLGNVKLVKATTYMNESGGSVRAVAEFYKVPPEGVLVVLDDLALPLGRLRIRKGGSGGGHNGLASVITHLGTTNVPRLRFGIGKPSDSMHDYVLSPFQADEIPALEEAIDRAVRALLACVTLGLEAAMNQYNQNPPTDS